jgi:hypothetical protein
MKKDNRKEVMAKNSRASQLKKLAEYQRKIPRRTDNRDVINSEERKANLYDFFKRIAIIAQTYTPRPSPF